MRAALLLLWMTLMSQSPCQAANNYPVIGILCEYTTPSDMGTLGDYFILEPYVNFIKQGGARVVPILLQQDESYYTTLLSKLNGVLIPGGTNQLVHSSFGDAAHIIYKWVIKTNDEGTYFPMWGTCLGHESIVTSTVGADNLKTWCDSKNRTFNLQFETKIEDSRLLNSLTDDVITNFKTSRLSFYFNHFCYKPETIKGNPKLNSFYKLLATSENPMGGKCTSMLEARDYPIYSTQWHPEMPSWVWWENMIINHSLEAIKMGLQIATFFVNEARKNSHSFDSIEERHGFLIERQNPVYVGYPTDTYVYFYFHRNMAPPAGYI